jgi:hypothetical protein
MSADGRQQNAPWSAERILEGSTDDAGSARCDRGGATKVLVAYASKHGPTAEIPQAVGETLREGGLSVH